MEIQLGPILDYIYRPQVPDQLVQGGDPNTSQPFGLTWNSPAIRAHRDLSIEVAPSGHIIPPTHSPSCILINRRQPEPIQGHIVAIDNQLYLGTPCAIATRRH